MSRKVSFLCAVTGLVLLIANTDSFLQSLLGCLFILFSLRYFLKGE